MKKKEIEKLEEAAQLLNNEGFVNRYDGYQARQMWQAQQEIEKALEVIEVEND